MSDFKRIVCSVGTVIYLLLGLFGILYAIANYEDVGILFLHMLVVIAMFNMALTLYGILILTHKAKVNKTFY